jgi:hypothetical protein
MYIPNIDRGIGMTDDFYESWKRERQLENLEHCLKDGLVEKIKRKLKEHQNNVVVVSALFLVPTVIAGIIGIYGGFNLRNGIEQKAWNQLNNQEHISCLDDECSELENFLEQNQAKIITVIEKTGIIEPEIKALIAAAYLNPHKQDRKASGYYGVIPLNPLEVGMTEDLLENDLDLNLFTAVNRLKQLEERYDLPEIALAVLFGDQRDVEQALEIASDINASFHRSGRVGYSRADRLEKHRAYQKGVDYWQKEIEQADPEEQENWKIKFTKWKRDAYDEGYVLLGEEFLEKNLLMEKQTVWTNNLENQFTRKALFIYYGYLD